MAEATGTRPANMLFVWREQIENAALDALATVLAQPETKIVRSLDGDVTVEAEGLELKFYFGDVPTIVARKEGDVSLEGEEIEFHLAGNVAWLKGIYARLSAPEGTDPEAAALLAVAEAGRGSWEKENWTDESEKDFTMVARLPGRELHLDFWTAASSPDEPELPRVAFDLEETNVSDPAVVARLLEITGVTL